MKTRIMAVALVVVGLVGVTHAEEVDLVRIVPVNALNLDVRWSAFPATIIVIGQPNDETVTFPGQCTGGIAGQTRENVEVVALLAPGIPGAARLTILQTSSEARGCTSQTRCLQEETADPAAVPSADRRTGERQRPAAVSGPEERFRRDQPRETCLSG